MNQGSDRWVKFSNFQKPKLDHLIMNIIHFLLSASLVATLATGLTCPAFTSTDERDYAHDNQWLVDGKNLLYAVFGDDDYFMKNVENISKIYKIDHKISVKCYNFNKIDNFYNQNIKKFIDNASGSRVMLLYSGVDRIDSDNVSTMNELLKFTDSTTSYSNVINVVYWNTDNENVHLDSSIDHVKDYIGNYINSINGNMSGHAIAGRIHRVALQDCTDGENNKDMHDMQVNKSMNIESFCRSFDDAREQNDKLYEKLYLLAIITGTMIVLSIIYTLYLLLHTEKSKKTNTKKNGTTSTNNGETVVKNNKNSTQTSPTNPSSTESTPENRHDRRVVKSPVRQRVISAKKDASKETTNINEKSNRMNTRSQGKKSN